jgi:hypothetical protein
VEQVRKRKVEQVFALFVAKCTGTDCFAPPFLRFGAVPQDKVFYCETVLDCRLWTVASVSYNTE